MSEHAFKRPVSVLVVIHTPALEVLLLERLRPPGLWQSVTGSLEHGEDALVAARREVAEETGLEVSCTELVDWRWSNRFLIRPEWRSRYEPGVTHNIEHVFSLMVREPVTVRLSADEHVASRWLPWREAATQVFSWTNREALLALPRRFAGAVNPPPSAP